MTVGEALVKAVMDFYRYSLDHVEVGEEEAPWVGGGGHFGGSGVGSEAGKWGSPGRPSGQLAVEKILRRPRVACGSDDGDPFPWET